MSESTLVLWDDVVTSYDFGRDHPLRPLRLALTMSLARDLAVLDRPGVTVAAPVPADDALLELVHDRDYIGYVKVAPDDALGRFSLAYGLGPGDNPIFPGMHEASALVSGASVDGARAVWSGRAQHAVNIAGGLHHAMRDRASGFCIYDDPAIAIAWLLAEGAQRVAYVDCDVHHGDGVQAAFWTDPRVLTISLHESGRYLFPGTGFPEETGAGEARGTSVNVALPPRTGDAGWLRAFDAVVPELLRAFRPQVLVTQCGADTHARDPLAHLALTVDGQRTAYHLLHRLAHELCDGRWLAVGGGGYDAVHVVPRAWTHLLAEVSGPPVLGVVPDTWREEVRARAGVEAPESLTDGLEAGIVPVDAWPGADALELGGRPAPLDAAILATRSAVFPAHGLDPRAPAGGNRAGEAGSTA